MNRQGRVERQSEEAGRRGGADGQSTSVSDDRVCDYALQASTFSSRLKIMHATNINKSFLNDVLDPA
jgi:hypothetical protein